MRRIYINGNSMSLNPTISREILFRSMISLLCCMMIGFMRYGVSIFNVYDHRFAIIAFGFIGSMFFFALVKLEIRHALFILFVLFFANSILLTKSFQHKYLYGDLLSVGTLAAAIYLFYCFVYLRSRLTNIFSPLILGVLVGLTAFGERIIYSLLFRRPVWFTFDFSSILAILHGTAVEFFVGLGIGVGILVTSFSVINKSLKFT